MNIPSLGRYDTEQWRATTVTCLKAYIKSLNTLLEKLETHLITRIYTRVWLNVCYKEIEV